MLGNLGNWILSKLWKNESFFILVFYNFNFKLWLAPIWAALLTFHARMNETRPPWKRKQLQSRERSCGFQPWFQAVFWADLTAHNLYRSFELIHRYCKARDWRDTQFLGKFWILGKLAILGNWILVILGNWILGHLAILGNWILGKLSILGNCILGILGNWILGHCILGKLAILGNWIPKKREGHSIVKSRTKLPIDYSMFLSHNKPTLIWADLTAHNLYRSFELIFSKLLSTSNFGTKNEAKNQHWASTKNKTKRGKKRLFFD